MPPKKLRQALHQTGSSENFSQTSILVRASSRLLSCAFTPDLALWVLKKQIFIRNGEKWHLFRGCKQTKCPFFRTGALKIVHHAPNAYNSPLLLCSRCLHPLFQNRYPFILLPSLFQPPGHDLQKSRQKVSITTLVLQD